VIKLLNYNTIAFAVTIGDIFKIRRTILANLFFCNSQNNNSVEQFTTSYCSETQSLKGESVNSFKEI